ncbi:MAG: cation:proton antiporter [Candidatus Thermoplasmatota archaeon]
MLLEIALAIICAKSFGFLFEKIKQPGVIGEIIGGIILGPSLLGSLSGSTITLFDTTFITFTLDLTSEEFKEIAFIGVVFLLFIVGLETNISDLKKTKRSGILAGLFGVIIPFCFGTIVGLFFSLDLLQSMALGTILLATSATIAIRILTDIDMLSTRIGLTLNTAIVVNDILAMIIFALVFRTGNSWGLVVQILLFFSCTISLGVIIGHFLKKTKIAEKSPAVVLMFGLIICFLFAAFAENLGITAIIGAFIAGLFIRKTHREHQLCEFIKTIGYAFFIPLFFVWVGATFNFWYLFEAADLSSLIFFIVAFVITGLVSNFLGGSVGARLAGLNRRDSISVGIGMMPVMGVALIIVTTGIDNHIFGEPNGILANQIKISTLLLIIISSLISPFLLKRSIRSPLLGQIGKTKTKPAIYHHPHCSECDSPLRLMPQSKQWYCDHCQLLVQASSSKSTQKQSAKKSRIDTYVQYIIGVATIMICGIALQNMESSSIVEKIFSLVGILLGTMLGFLTVNHLFLRNKYQKIQ